MLTCEECMRDMYPDDPHIKSGKYHMCSCDYCNNQEQVVEQPELLDTVEVRQLKYQVEQARAGYLHLENRLNRYLKKKESNIKKDSTYIYSTIIEDDNTND
jgi:hypothetical protein